MENKCKHFQRQTTVIQRLVHKFDLYHWMYKIGQCLRFSSPVTIWVGFSLIVKDEFNNRAYIYAIRQLASYNFKFTSRGQYEEYCKKQFEDIKLHDRLQKTYISTKDDNPFYKSGFRPFKLISCYVWIRK